MFIVDAILAQASAWAIPPRAARPPIPRGGWGGSGACTCGLAGRPSPGLVGGVLPLVLASSRVSGGELARAGLRGAVPWGLLAVGGWCGSRLAFRWRVGLASAGVMRCGLSSTWCALACQRGGLGCTLCTSGLVGGGLPCPLLALGFLLAWGGWGPFHRRLTKLARLHHLSTLSGLCPLRHVVLAVMIVIAVAGYGACRGSCMIIMDKVHHVHPCCHFGSSFRLGHSTPCWVLRI